MNWIDVKEKQPEEVGDYLAYAKGYDGIPQVAVTWDGYNFYDAEGNRCSHHVTHWAELPISLPALSAPTSQGDYVECTCANGEQAENCDKKCGHGQEPEPSQGDEAVNDVVFYTEQDMINAYWGGLNGYINDYDLDSESGAGRGAEKWLKEYKQQHFTITKKR